MGEGGEFALVAAIGRLLAARAAADPSVALGPGDDCAIVRPTAGLEILFTTDEALEGVHFERRWLAPRAIGRRAMTQNLSDVAAMAGRPRWALLALALPEGLVAESLEIVGGAAERAAEAGCTVVGGNVTRGPRLGVTIALAGEVEAGRALRRAGARAGDALYVTGDPGMARAGLLALQAGREAEETLAAAVERWRAPPARIEEARFLRDRAGARAMIDLSDGLSGDIAHLAALSGVGAVVERAALPVGAALERAARALGTDARDLVLAGGEDYELLFAAPEAEVEAARPEFEARFGTALTRIGVARAAPGLELAAPGEPPRALPATSYDHFGAGNKPA